MRKIVSTLAIVASLSLAGSAAQAQTLFAGSGCSGNTFLFCGSWTATYVDATHFNLFITNTSQIAPASNLSSVFTQIGLGNLSLSDPGSMGAVTGWQFDANLNGFGGFGLLENQFGSITTNGINNGLTAGASQLFSFSMSSSIGTYPQASTAFAGAQIAIHDQGGPVAGCSSKGVLVGDAAGQNTSSISGCLPTTTTPEPSSYALMATGLVGIVGFARRRRGA